MIKVIDNFISKQHQDEIEDLVTSSDFDWYYNKYSVSKQTSVDIGDKSLDILDGFSDDFQFTHNLLNNNKMSWAYYNVVDKLITGDIFNTATFSRIKFNFTVPNISLPRNCPGIPHMDKCNTPYTALYYVNNSDGDTIIFNEKYNKDTEYKQLTVKQRVSPKKGTLVIFDSEYIHSSSLPFEYNSRIVLNINFNLGL